MAFLYKKWDQNKVYQPLEYTEYPSGSVYICIQTATQGESPLTKPLKWKLAFGSSFPGTVSSITATLPIALTPDPLTTTGDVTTSMSTNKLIGRYTAGTGVMEEIAIGSGLTLSGGGTLSASIGGLAWLLAGNTVTNDNTFIGSLDNFDYSFYTNNTSRMRLFKTGELGIGITASPLGTLHVKGKGGSQSAFYVENNAGSYTWENRDDGTIRRTGTLFSRETSVGNVLTTWGYNAGGSVATGAECTMVGHAAGATLASGNGLTAIGAYALVVATVSSNTGLGSYAGRNHTSGHSCTYLGFSAGYPAGAGDNATGNYSTAIGTYAFIGGNLSNVLSICGVGTQANQIVLGGATNLNNAATCHYESMRVVYSSDLSKIHDTFFRTSTPESAQAATRGSIAFVDDATDGEGYLKTTGTGNTGWGQILAATAVTTEIVVSDTTLTIVYQGVTYKLLALA